MYDFLLSLMGWMWLYRYYPDDELKYRGSKRDRRKSKRTSRKVTETMRRFVESFSGPFLGPGSATSLLTGKSEKRRSKESWTKGNNWCIFVFTYFSANQLVFFFSLPKTWVLWYAWLKEGGYVYDFMMDCWLKYCCRANETHKFAVVLLSLFSFELTRLFRNQNDKRVY